MRKIFLFLLPAFLLLVGGADVWASSNTSTVSSKFTATGNVTSKFTQTGNFTSAAWNLAVTWKNTASWQNLDGTKGSQIGTGDHPASSIVLTGSSIPGTISSVVVNTSGASSVNATVAVSVGGTGFTCGGNSTASITSSAANYTFTGSGSGDVVITWTQSSSKALYIKSVSTTYATGSTPSTLALTGDPITLNFDLYDNKAAQEITYTTDGSGTVSVVANDYVDATVNPSTKKISVTPKKVTGTAQTITVNQAADVTYAEGNVTFKVNIIDSTPAETFEKITSADDLATGDELIFVYESSDKAAGTISSGYCASVGVDIDSYEIEVVNGDGVNVFVLGGQSGAWTLYSKMNNGYLKETSTNLSTEDVGSNWTISFTDGNAVVIASNQLQYNASSPRFKTYSSSQKSIQLYRKVVDRKKVTVGSTGYTTYVTKGKVAFPVGVTAYIATAASGSAITLQSVASAPANTAVVIQASEGNYDLTDKDSPDACTGNILKASDGYKKGNGTSIYALGNKSAGVGFYLVTNDATIPVGKAYLIYAGGGSAPSMLRFVEEETGATNIDATKAVEEGVKFIENGKLFIKKNGVVYDMLGTVVR